MDDIAHEFGKLQTTDTENYKNNSTTREVCMQKVKEAGLRNGKEIVHMFSNLFEIDVEAGSYFRYEIRNSLIIKNDGKLKKTIDLTPNTSSNDVQKIQIRVSALQAVFEKYKLNVDGSFAYDGACTLFTTTLLDLSHMKTGELYIVEALSLPFISQIFQRNKVDELEMHVSIVACAKSFNPADTKLETQVRKQFLEIVTSSPILYSNDFVLINDAIFAVNLPDSKKRKMQWGTEARYGLSKSVRFIEGKKGRSNDPPVPHMNLDVTTTIFFKPQILKHTVDEIVQSLSRGRHAYNAPFPFGPGSTEFKNINSFVKGLKLEVHGYEKKMQITADGITNNALSRITTEIEGKERSILEIYSSDVVANFSLEFPAVYTLRRKDGKLTKKYYPMELLRIVDHQKVPLSKQFTDPPQALKPDVRVSIWAEYMKFVGLSESQHDYHRVLKSFGIILNDSPLRLTGFMKEKPKIMYGSNQRSTPHNVNGNWRLADRCSYLIPGVASQIVFAFRCNSQIAKSASDSIMSMLESRGFKLGNFVGVSIRNTTDLEKQFSTACQIMDKDPKEFILIIFFDDKHVKEHDHLKLLERKYLVTSQQLTTDIAKKIPTSRLTLSNIVNKINLKCGGINHSIIPDAFSRNRWLNKGNMFVMGYDVAHPTGRRTRSEKLGDLPPPNPSVVGFSWNGGPHPEGFIGDFAFQEAFKETISSNLLNEHVKMMLSSFVEKYNFPEYFVIVRDGVSEGQYNMVVKEEFAAIEEACEEFARKSNKKWRPKFILFVVTKRHNLRFYRNTNGVYENLLPGTVADTSVVRKDVTEFFLHSHRVIQGTGKAPSYQILIDEINMSMDEAQSLMHALTYDHQIIESPISLPEPVYQADAWATRGTKLFKAYESLYNVPIQKRKSGEEHIDYLVMTQKLGYWNTRLSHTRINA